MTHDRRLEGSGKEFLEFVDLVEPIAGVGKHEYHTAYLPAMPTIKMSLRLRVCTSWCW